MTASLRKQLNVWKSVLFALFLRELQSQFNDKLGLTWAFIEPFIFIVGLAALRSLMKSGDVHTIPVLIFMMIGLISIQSFLTPLGKLSNAFNKNKPLYAFRQVQPIAGLIAAAIIEFSIKVVVIMLGAITLYLSNISSQINDPLLLIALYMCLWLFTFSVSCIVGVVKAYVPEFSKLVNIITRPMFFISCVFFSLQDIPQQYWPYLTWNPLVHIIELSRYACYESYGDSGVSFWYPVSITLTSCFFAISLYHLNWKGILSR
ncbi:MAG: ABC transporter permease [Pseudomonadota bacterium]|nr:ABC transporter permease [Pseudomonadota bacterium]